jgi:hypothetical protein
MTANFALHRIAARWRFLLNVKRYSWAARGELAALLRHEVASCTAERQEEGMI